MASSSRELAQQQTFTLWINNVLKQTYGPAGPVITSLPHAFSDGIVLLKLVKALRPDTMLPSYNRKPKTRIHRVDNVALALSVCEQGGFVLHHADAVSLVDGHRKVILGRKGKEALLLWVKQSTAPYTGVEVTNFTRDWVSGLAFAALIHSKRPDALDFDSVTGLSGPVDRLETVFDAAQSKLDVPCLLDAEAVVNVSDERSILTYVAVLFDKLGQTSSAAPSSSSPKAEPPVVKEPAGESFVDQIDEAKADNEKKQDKEKEIDNQRKIGEDETNGKEELDGDNEKEKNEKEENEKEEDENENEKEEKNEEATDTNVDGREKENNLEKDGAVDGDIEKQYGKESNNEDGEQGKQSVELENNDGQSSSSLPSESLPSDLLSDDEHRRKLQIALRAAVQRAARRRDWDRLVEAIRSFVADVRQATEKLQLTADNGSDLSDAAVDRDRLLSEARGLLDQRRALASAMGGSQGDGVADAIEDMYCALEAWEHGFARASVAINNSNQVRQLRDTAAAAPSSSLLLGPAQNHTEPLTPSQTSAVATVGEMVAFLSTDSGDNSTKSMDVAAELLFELTEDRPDDCRWAARHIGVDYEQLCAKLQHRLTGSVAGNTSDADADVAAQALRLHVRSWQCLLGCDGAADEMDNEDADDGRFFELCTSSMDQFEAQYKQHRALLGDLDQDFVALSSQAPPLPHPVGGAVAAVSQSIAAGRDRLTRSETALRLGRRVCEQAETLCRRMCALADLLSRETLAEQSSLARLPRDQVQAECDRQVASVDRVASQLSDELAEPLESLRATVAEMEETGEAPWAALRAAARVELHLTSLDDLIDSRTRAAQVDELLLNEISDGLADIDHLDALDTGHQQAAVELSSGRPNTTVLASLREQVRQRCTEAGCWAPLADKPDSWLDTQLWALASEHRACPPAGVLLRIVALARRDMQDRRKLLHAFSSLAADDGSAVVCCVPKEALQEALSPAEFQYLASVMDACSDHPHGYNFQEYIKNTFL